MNKFDLNKPIKVTAANNLAGGMGQIEENQIAGVAALAGVMNANRCVFYPGAFSGAIQGFLKRGFISPDHSWNSEDSVAMPVAASETGNRVEVTAEFHSTADAQELRTKCQERMARGLFVGFSVGINAGPKDWGWFESGQTLLEHAIGYGCDMSLFDPSLKDQEDLYGIFKVTDWVEWAITLNPAEKRAGATAIASLGGGMTFEEELDAALAAVSGCVSRADQIQTLRLEQGRNLSDSRLALLLDVRSSLDAILSRVPDDAPRTSDAEAAYRYLELAHRQAQLKAG